MLKFFSINDVFRLVFVFVILLGIRIPFIILNEDIMVTELNHLIIGQKMSEGFLIYKSIVDFTAPFSALIYHALFWMFGKSVVALQVFSIFIVTLQLIIFNYWVNRLELLTERTFVPSIIFSVVASCTLGFQTLSPVMMATTFLMIAVFKALQVMKLGDVSEVMYKSGIYLGVAILFYSPMIFFVIPLFVSLMAYSNIKPKKYIVYFYGVLFPLFCIGVFFLWKRALSFYLVDIVYYAFSLSKRVLVSLEGVGVAFLLLLILSVIGFQKGLFSQRYISFQKRSITVFFFVTIGFLFLIAFAPSINYTLFYALVPVAVYYLSILFDVKYITNKVEMGFLLVLICLIAGGYLHFFYEEPFEKSVVTRTNSQLKGKVLILGEDVGLYAQEDVVPATGFVNWELSKRYFFDSTSNHIAKVRRFLDRDTPVYIQDQEEALSLYTEQSWFKEKYEQSDEGLYQLRK